ARSEKANVALGCWIRANTTPQAAVAHFWAGATPYFSERRGIDLLGKCDPVIAREPAHPGLMRPGHNKYDLSHSLALAPDVIVSGHAGRFSFDDLVLRHRLDEDRARAPDPYRAFTDLYFEPAFRRDFLGVADARDIGNLKKMTGNLAGAGMTPPDEFA